MLGLAAHFLLTGATLGPDDRHIFGVTFLDARVAYVIIGILGGATVVFARLRPWWLVLMTPLTWGRAVTLLFSGSPDLARGAELRATTGWVLLWMLGILAVLVLEAADVMQLRGKDDG